MFQVGPINLSYLERLPADANPTENELGNPEQELTGAPQ
jgi:hypothetical protein